MPQTPGPVTRSGQQQGPHVPATKGVARRLAAALCLVVGAGGLAHGLEYAPGAGKPGRRVDFLLALDVGTDTNVTRAASGDEKSDTSYGFLAGLELAGNYRRNKYHLNASTRYGQYASLDEFNFQEYAVDGALRWASRKAGLDLRAKFTSPNDPVEVETYKMELLERRELSYTPGLMLSSGKSEFGIEYGFDTIEYDNFGYSYLDHRETAWRAEYRFWLRPQASLVFLRWDSAAVDYVLPYDPAPADFRDATNRKDFARAKVYVGSRSGSARKAHYELGAGAYMLSGGDLADASGPVLSARSTILRDEGNSTFEIAYTMNPEAAATADYKRAQRIQISYARNVNSRWKWYFAYRSEISDFQNPDQDTSDSLSIQLLHAGLERNLGSARGWHGRFHLAVGGEFSEDFSRFRANLGLGLAH